MTPFNFTKMHGLGNDFIVINNLNQNIHLSSHDIQQLSCRHRGIGFDQCLMLEPSSQVDVDFFYRIFNANGESVGQCGNGARCLARFIQHYGLSKATTLTVATTDTRLILQLNPNDSVTVNMGQPHLTPQLIPMTITKQAVRYAISMPNGEIEHVHAISMGNPHAIVMVEDINAIAVASRGQALSLHPVFPKQCNVSFLSIERPNCIHLRVYERGCGETQACGSAAVAAMAIGRLHYQLSDDVAVHLPGGVLQVTWPDENGPLFLTGSATFVYEGRLF